jgi:hypothetical protein
MIVILVSLYLAVGTIQIIKYVHLYIQFLLLVHFIDAATLLFYHNYYYFNTVF